MVERKKHLSNVAFGGAWSEQLIEQDALNEVMSVLRRASEECADRDVNDRDLMSALSYVRGNIEKGPMLVAGFQKALLEPNPTMRQESVKRYVEMIFTWAGY